MMSQIKNSHLGIINNNVDRISNLSPFQLLEIDLPLKDANNNKKMQC